MIVVSINIFNYLFLIDPKPYTLNRPNNLKTPQQAGAQLALDDLKEAPFFICLRGGGGTVSVFFFWAGWEGGGATLGLGDSCGLGPF